MQIFVLVLSVVITVFILKIINRNTFGTVSAYAKRAFTTWIVVLFILVYLFKEAGVI
jgi:hypothetical protein